MSQSVMSPALTADRRAHGAASELLRALASPARVSIVMTLRDRPMCVHELVDALALNQPQVSQHLRVLKQSGVVVGSRRGREVEYSLADDHVAHIVVDAVLHAAEHRTEAQT
ncbi:MULTISPECIES: ArsR/SmtB family transcription factor [Gordonia]|uniref:HTH arsR-type domain-containing protein n=2 Tax=Gordonia TaxID=2053 RepID=A0ABN3HBK4_9ACTN|nr:MULTISPECIES: metalloregulator ArsR/SmtB family transcription factor [Gordonia]AUH68574.1 transcriptional regulator [Gordonia sp. YC-JH1]KJR07040.1 ArsR family transcriptional regulator [Gordonia sihwensis]KXT55992.1 ArsR family transcriptional regulator [Gordonia sp. QH-12]MBY4571100.1 transcriptional regulator [Gordonia sihwensis]GAC62249.1 putative ArsR family transcriptional regulator [Gordonia sihwensis NBRC 108236]